ncbi:hypothetical protein EV589_1929 [Mycobacterium sp. BK558]|nr:hypothetical protein EV589_1929 [Mycobacterium sp. BK558]
MVTAFRPCLFTGIALVGASVIAVTPVTAAPSPEIRVADPAVQLTAAASPPALYAQVVKGTLANAGALVYGYLGASSGYPREGTAPSGPFPIIQALLGKDIDAPRICSRYGCEGEIGVDTALTWLGMSSVSWVIAGVLATGAALSDIAAAVVRLDLVGFINAVVDAPALIASGVLNGFPERSDSSELITRWPGLLNPGGPGIGGVPGLGSGIPLSRNPGFIGGLIYLDQVIGAAISSLFHPAPTPLAPLNQGPAPRALTLTLAALPVVDSPSNPGLASSELDTTAQAQQGLGAATDRAARATNEPTPTGSDAVTDTSGAGAADAANAPTTTGPDAVTDPSAAGPASATDELAQAGSKASTEGQHNLDTATSATSNAIAGIPDPTEVQPGQAGGNGAPSSGDTTEVARPIGDQPGSALSEPANDANNTENKGNTSRSKSRLARIRATFHRFSMPHELVSPRDGTTR